MEVPRLSRSNRSCSCWEQPVHVLQAESVRFRSYTSLLGSCFRGRLGYRLAVVSPERAILRRPAESTVVCDGRHPLQASETRPLRQHRKHREPPSDVALPPPTPGARNPSGPRKKNFGRKELGSSLANEQLERSTLRSTSLANAQRAGLGSPRAATRSARPSRRRHSPEIHSRAEIEEEGTRKREKAKEQKAMAEANGFRLSKRSKKNPEECQYVVNLNMCSKHGDLRGALEIYDKVREGDLFKFKQHYYNTLLYICSGAASGSIVKGKGGKASSTAEPSDTKKPPEKYLKNKSGASEQALEVESENTKGLEAVTFSPDEMQLAARRGTEIYEDMVQSEVPPNEATYTAVARLAVAKGDGDMAFETVKKMSAAGMVPKLRTYGPALLCFCEHNQIEKAFKVDEHMVAAGVLPDENLLEAMLTLSIAAGLEARVYSLLQRLRKTVREVSPSTVSTIEKWFNSEAAASAGNHGRKSPPSEEEIRKTAECRGGGWHGLGWLGEGKWKTTRTTINKTGICQSCGERLCSIDLDPEETDNFAKSVAELAVQRERNPNEFLTFQEWLEKQGAFEAIVDGANIGMYNLSHRGFNYNQVVTVADSLKTRKLIQKSPLIVLHRRRISDGGSHSPRSKNIIDTWVKENALFSTPHGSNDDWYWLYAAVKCKCLLVTNDEMRDHLFELLGNNFFPKWKERHQVRFTFSSNGLELLMPPPYSTIIQESQTGSWHIPQAGHDDPGSSQQWLCATRSSLSCLKSRSSTTSEQKSDVDVVSSLELGQQANNSNFILSHKGELVDCFSQAIEGPAVAYLSETLRKLEAAERASMSPINFEI